MRFLLLFVAGIVFAERVPWEASKIHGTPEPTPIFQLERAFPKLNFTDPVELTWASEFKRFILVELGTKVHLFANDPKVTDTTLLLDLKAAKPEATRVYSFTLHPQFVKNRRAYMVYNYQIDENKRGGTRVSELQITKELKVEGFMTHFRHDRYDEAREHLSQWLRDGVIQSPEHRLEGIENVGKAFADLFAGENFGKTIVAL